MTVVVFLDASVLYGATTRSVLLYLAIAQLYRARWSDQVQDEWTRKLSMNRPDLDALRIARTRALMDTTIPDALVSGYEAITPTITLPDPDDRHVVAAAIHGGATVIVTSNLRHFPASALAPLNLTAEPPDIFIQGLIGANPPSALEAFAIDRAAMTSPPMSVVEYLFALEKVGLLGAAEAIRKLGAMI